jgi:hypothetical protein
MNSVVLHNPNFLQLSFWKHLSKREQQSFNSLPQLPPIVMLEASQQTRARVLGFNKPNFLQLSCWKHLNKREQEYWVSTTIISSNCHAGSISTNENNSIGFQQPLFPPTVMLEASQQTKAKVSGRF